MKPGDRHKHPLADRAWDVQTHTDTRTGRQQAADWNNQFLALYSDIRDTLQDIRDEMQETNRILRVTFGVEERKD